MTKENKLHLSFLATDEYIIDNIIRPTETKGKDFVTWGEDNDYPQYLNSLYENVPTLKTIIDAMTDYICGDDIIIGGGWDTLRNKKHMTIKRIVRHLAKDYVKYGGFAFNILFDQSRQIVQIYYLDFSRCRINEEQTKLFYSTQWNDARAKYISIPMFGYEKEGEYSVAFYYSNDITKTYPTPTWAAAVLPCEIEKLINEYDINLIRNGFSSNYIVNFNSGKPTDEQKAEIEYEFYDKFTGINNTGRPMLTFNTSKDNEATVVKIDSDNFADKYTKLQETARSQIFTAFRVTPNLIGLPTETTGFNSQEYAEAFKLLQKTVVQPLQQDIEENINLIFGFDMLKFKPFSISFEEKDVTLENEK